MVPIGIPSHTEVLGQELGQVSLEGLMQNLRRWAKGPATDPPPLPQKLENRRKQKSKVSPFCGVHLWEGNEGWELDWASQDH